MIFAVIQSGGKQYRVAEGDRVKVEKLEVKAGENITFDKVLMVSNGDAVTLGKPYIAGTSVEAEVVAQDRHDKVIVFKYHSKTRQRKKKGHRQWFTEVKIKGISH